jgi:hypothetical protein
MFWEWEEMKSAEQWCFSIVKNERVADNGVSATEKGETIAGRSCFGNENDEEMADWSVLGVGRNEKC